MTWSPNYAPVDTVLASAAIVLLPIVILFIMIFTTRTLYAAWTALILLILIATLMYHMPVGMTLIAACNGALYGAWPICLIIFAAIFLFDMCVITGHFETVKYTIVSITKDKRLLALLLAYLFSGFIEGASGFSTPIALASSMMIGVGFSKSDACKAALLGNTIPVVFGGIGIPVTTLATVARLPANALAQAASRLLMPFALLQPFLIVYSISSFKQMVEVWPACLLTAVVQTGMSMLLAQYTGPSACSILSMIATLGTLGAFVKFWQPKNILMTESMAAEEAGLMSAAAVHAIAHEGASPSSPTSKPLKIGAAALETGRSSNTSSAPLSDRGSGSAMSDRVGAASPQDMLSPHLSLRLDRGRPLTGGAATALPHTGVVAEEQSMLRLTHVESVGSTGPMLEGQHGQQRAHRGSIETTPGATPSSSIPLRVESIDSTTTSGGGAGAAVHRLSPGIERTPTVADTPSLTMQDGHVLLLRRAVLSALGKRQLDSSSVSTALFPHTLEHEYSLTHRTHGKFVRVTRDGNQLLRLHTTPAVRTPSGPVVAAASGSTLSSSLEGGPSMSNAADVLGSTPREGGLDDVTSGTPAPAVVSTALTTTTSRSVDSNAAVGLDAVSVEVMASTTTSAAAATPVKPSAAAYEGLTGSAAEHAKEASGPQAEVAMHYDALHPPTTREIITAWFPWVLVAVLVVIWGVPPVKGDATLTPMTGLQAATFIIPMTGLDQQVVKPPPSGVGPGSIVHATWTLDLVGATGICLFICAFITSAVFQLHPKKTLWILWTSFRRMALSMFTICTLLSLGYVIKYSGMDYTLGMAAAESLGGYPFISPLIGFLGVVVTGSATTSNVLFGSLQVVAATQLNLNPVQMAASNVAGGILGHVISTSSMMVAAVSTGSDSKNISIIAKSVIGYAISLIIAFCCWNMLVANVFPSYIPTAAFTS